MINFFNILKLHYTVTIFLFHNNTIYISLMTNNIRFVNNNPTVKPIHVET